MTTAPTVSNAPRRLPLAATTARLGVLSLHLDGTPCRVGCEFCYLGARADRAESAGDSISGTLLEGVLGALDYAEVAVALSEPIAQHVPALAAIVRAAAARGRPVAVTTTAGVLVELDAIRRHSGRDPLAGVARVNLSVDPRKGPTEPRWVAAAARRARGDGAGHGADGEAVGAPRQVALIASLVDESFAGWLIGGGLAELVALPEVDMVALHGLKPPPPWCDKRFWLAAFARLGPLLEKHLDRRLFLDCYVAARILQLGGCPARPDVSPGGAGAEFRSCVYQSSADFSFSSAGELASRLADFQAPELCPFPIR